LTRLPVSRAKSRTTNAHDAFAQLAKLPFEGRHVFLNAAPVGRRQTRLYARHRLGQPRAPDHEVADHPHEIVEPCQIDPHVIGGGQRRRRTFRHRGRHRSWTVVRNRRAHHAISTPRVTLCFSEMPTDHETECDRSALADDRRRADDVAIRAQPRADAVDVYAPRNEFRRWRKETLPRRPGGNGPDRCRECLLASARDLPELDDGRLHINRLLGVTPRRNRVLQRPRGLDQSVHSAGGQTDLAFAQSAQVRFHFMGERLDLPVLDHPGNALQ
jgi:hypothetical protein